MATVDATTALESKVVLIAGDWVVDEYWLLVRHHSQISSHTGFIHYRLSSKPTDYMRDLCGAGHVARVLYQLRDESRSQGAGYRIFGIGNWNDSDTATIKHLMHDQNDLCEAASACFKLSPKICKRKPDIDLITLNPDGPTTRVIRQYHNEHGQLEQINRVDWELDRSEFKIADPPREIYDKLPRADVTSLVVIHDLGKGAVTENLIKELRERYSGAKWYIRSKRRNPSWVKYLKDLSIVFVIGPELASLTYPWDNWLSRGRITAHGMEILDRGYPRSSTLIISEKREVIFCNREKGEVYTGASSRNPSVLNQLGWPSALVATLIHYEINKKTGLGREDIEGAISKADIVGGLESLLGRAEEEAGRGGEADKRCPAISVMCNSLKEESATWRSASSRLGIIGDPKGSDDLRLDVWRSTAHLPGYITCVNQKREIVGRIMRHMRAYKRGSRMASLSITLRADPGSGKTLLAKSLAAAFNFSFIGRDITQMIHREELLELFEDIGNRQISEGSNVLVFVDEINGKIDTGDVYGAFLSPLEEGTYRRRGRLFSLKPAVWIFAGTNFEDAKADKLEDFKSRMTLMESIDYATLESRTTEPTALQHEARLEQVYLGALMIRQLFSDVSTVTKEVLYQFYDIPPSSQPARKIKRMVHELRDVKYGRLERLNCENWGDISWGEVANGKKAVKLVF